jgi:uncharacterized membrane protein
MVSREELADHGVSRETWIGAGATALAVAAMAVDHLWDEDGGFSADPAAFFLSCGLSLALGFYVFGRLVPRARADGRRATPPLPSTSSASDRTQAVRLRPRPHP